MVICYSSHRKLIQRIKKKRIQLTLNNMSVNPHIIYSQISLSVIILHPQIQPIVDHVLL